jgi:hypothetical protein
MKLTGDLSGKDDLVDEIVKLVKPRPERMAECIEQLSVCVRTVKIVERNPVPSSVKKVRADVNRLARSLRTARSLADLLLPTRALLTMLQIDDQFLAKLDAVINAADKVAEGLVVEQGKKPRDNVKLAAAEMAADLVKNFSMTSRGRKRREFEAAALLYELVTKHKGVDLSDYRVHDDPRHPLNAQQLIIRCKLDG